MRSSTPVSRPLALDHSGTWGERWSTAGTAVAAFIALSAVAAANGGYDPPSWGLAAAPLLTAAALALAVRSRVVMSRPERIMLTAFSGLTGVMAVSALWSGDAGAGFLAAERALVYVGALATVFVLVRTDAVAGLLAGCLAAAAATVMNGLVGIVAPSTVAVDGVAQTGRMAAPIGYWNGLAVVAAIGILLGLGLAARSTTATARIAALAPLPLLAVGLYLTFSRGGWLVLALGMIAMLALETRRWQLAVVVASALPALALDVLVTAASPALTHVGSLLGPATAQGHRLGLVIAGTVPVMAAAALTTLWVERVWKPSRRVTRIARVVVLAAVLAGVAAPVVVYGSPRAVAQNLYNQFDARPPGGFRSTHGQAGKSLNDRLFNLSGNSRIQLWSSAWSDWRAHMVLGSGAGTYARWWLAHRQGTLKVQNAHSLYLETLAELGPLGLLVLLAGIGVPLVIAVRRRGSPLVAVAAAAYLAYVLHAGFDWDFQLPGVTLFGLVCGAAVLVAARPSAGRALRPWLRWSAVAIAAILVIAALAGLRGNLALDQSARATAAGNWSAAAADARIAHAWQPWSDAPWVALGEAELGSGHYASASTAFTHATRVAPGDWQAWFGLARSTSGAERRQALTRALRLDPHEPVLTLLARASGLAAASS
jgi:O-antigen ligase